MGSEIDKVEKIIIDWLKSDNENTTYLAHQICVSLGIIEDPNKSNIEEKKIKNRQIPNIRKEELKFLSVGYHNIPNILLTIFIMFIFISIILFLYHL